MAYSGDSTTCRWLRRPTDGSCDCDVDILFDADRCAAEDVVGEPVGATDRPGADQIDRIGAVAFHDQGVVRVGRGEDVVEVQGQGVAGPAREIDALDIGDPVVPDGGEIQVEVRDQRI